MQYSSDLTLPHTLIQLNTPSTLLLKTWSPTHFLTNQYSPLGHDGITHKTLTLVNNTCLDFLSQHHISYLQLRHFLKAWKHATCVIILKSNPNPTKAKSLRPISHLTIPGKILEHLVAMRVEKAALETGAIILTQFGIVTERSVIVILSFLLHHTTETLNTLPSSIPMKNGTHQVGKFSSL